VFDELRASRKFDVNRALASDWFEIRKITNQSLFELLLTELDAGEAEAITLAKELGAEVLLIDERKGRQKARALGIPIMGVAGILLTAKNLGLISKIEPILADLEYKAGFWLGDNLKKHVCELAGE